MKKFAVILAGGEGSRAGGNLPKQFVAVGGKPAVWWSMKAFKDADASTEIILVVHPGFFDDWRLINEEIPAEERIDHMVVCGGKDRPHSSLNGLLAVKELTEQKDDGEAGEIAVAIHDGARPLVSASLVNRGFEALEVQLRRYPTGCGVIPAVKPVSSLRHVSDARRPIDEVWSRSVDRAEYVEVQTPQIFRFRDIMEAFSHAGEMKGFTDDASVMEADGKPIRLFEGEVTNIKVTYPGDFELAEVLLRNRKKLTD